MLHCLPDKQIINIGKERFTCNEVLFNPEIIGKDSTSIHNCIVNSIWSVDADIRRNL